MLKTFKVFLFFNSFAIVITFIFSQFINFSPSNTNLELYESLVSNVNSSKDLFLSAGEIRILNPSKFKYFEGHTSNNHNIHNILIIHWSQKNSIGNQFLTHTPDVCLIDSGWNYARSISNNFKSLKANIYTDPINNEEYIVAWITVVGKTKLTLQNSNSILKDRMYKLSEKLSRLKGLLGLIINGENVKDSEKIYFRIITRNNTDFLVDLKYFDEAFNKFLSKNK